MSEPSQKCEINAICKQNYMQKLLISFKISCSCSFGFRGNLQFPDFLQKSSITTTTGAALPTSSVNVQMKSNLRFLINRTLLASVCVRGSWTRGLEVSVGSLAYGLCCRTTWSSAGIPLSPSGPCNNLLHPWYPCAGEWHRLIFKPQYEDRKKFVTKFFELQNVFWIIFLDVLNQILK